MASTFPTGAESFDTASDVTVEFSGGCAAVPTLVSERDLPPDPMTGIGAAVGAVRDPVDVVIPAVDGVAGMPVDVAPPIWATPVPAATPAGPGVVFEPVDVEVMVDLDVEEAADVVEGLEAEPDAGVFGSAVDELVDVAWLTDAPEVESEDDELDGTAHAIPWLVDRATPTPSASARPPIRPTNATPRTRQLYRRR